MLSAIEVDADTRKAQLGRDLVRASYLMGDFILRSGRHSHYYFDKYLFETKPHLLRQLARFLADMIAPGTDRLAGPELGAVPLVTALALETGLPFVIVKKQVKDYATGRHIEGELFPGERVTLVEDVLTTGTQAIVSAEALRASQVQVLKVLAVLDRQEGADEAMGRAGLNFEALFTRASLRL